MGIVSTVRSWFAPDRRQARPVALRARYDAAQTTDDNSNHWAYADALGAATANSEAVRHKLRTRARYERANNCFANGMIRTVANHVVGAGPRLQIQTDDETVNQQIEDEWERWARRIGLADKLRTMRMAKCCDGEAFAMLVSNPNINVDVTLDVRLVECDQISGQYRTNTPRHIDGIEFDRYGNPITYYLLDQHPGDSLAFARSFETRPIDAESMIHWFRRDRPGQVRGIPEITPALPLYAVLRRYTLAVLHSAETAANLSVVLETSGPVDPAEVEAFEALSIERNAMTTMPEGWKMSQLKAEQPTTAHDAFQRSVLREIARCMDMPYNIAAGDSSSYNYSSGKLDDQTWGRMVQIDRIQGEIDVLDKIAMAWKKEAELFGIIPKVERWNHNWHWPPAEDIDPVKEADAAVTLRTAGLLSDRDIFARKQKDWREEYRQLAREQELRAELGLTNAPQENATPAQPAATTGANADFGGLSRLQWTRNRRAISDVLDDVVSGKSSDLAAQTMLESLGLSPEKAAALIADAHDGSVDDPAMKIEASGESKHTFGAASVTLSAIAGEGLPTFSMVAYTGGKLHLAGRALPIVLDLKGTRAQAATIPTLRDHKLDQELGHIPTFENTGSELRVAGVLSAVNEHQERVVNAARNGYQWQASVGGTMQQIEHIEAGQAVTVNGQVFAGPVDVARDVVIQEVSFVSLGADITGTTVAVAAILGVNDMDLAQYCASLGIDINTLNDAGKAAMQKQLDTVSAAAATVTPATNDGSTTTVTPSAAPVAVAATADLNLQASRSGHAAELRRIDAINKLAASYPGSASLAADAIEKGWQADQFELHALKASRPTGPAIHVHGGDSANNAPQVLKAAAMQALGVRDLENDGYSPQVLQAAHSAFRGRIGLHEMLGRCAISAGYVGSTNFRTHGKDILRAAFSSTEASGIFADVANKFLLEGYNTGEMSWKEIAATRNVSDFKTSYSYRLNADMGFDKVAPDGKLKHGKIADVTYSNSVDTYGRMFALTRKDLINDDLGALQAIPGTIGRYGIKKLNEVFWPAFYAGDGTFWHTSHTTAGDLGKANKTTGAFASATLATAESLFMMQEDTNGNPIGVMPKKLLVPPALKRKAMELMSSANFVSGNTTKEPSANTFQGAYDVVVSSYLQNASYGNSSVIYYLLADPRELPVVEVAFLNGQQNPTVEEVDVESDTLGMAFRGYFDFGVAQLDFRGGVKSTGA